MLQGAQAHCGYLCQRSYFTMVEAEIDHLRVPAFFDCHGKRLSQEPQQQKFVFYMFLHGCRNLRFSSASFSTLFAWYFYSHGEGLSREPYSGYSHFFGTYLKTFLVTIVFSVYLSVFEYFFLGYCVSCQICTWCRDSAPDG